MTLPATCEQIFFISNGNDSSISFSFSPCGFGGEENLLNIINILTVRDLSKIDISSDPLHDKIVEINRWILKFVIRYIDSVEYNTIDQEMLIVSETNVLERIIIGRFFYIE